MPLALLLAGGPWWSWLAAAVVAGVLVTEPVRRFVVTAPVLELLRALKFLPKISDTEREALEAGTIWVDGELFSGRPDFDRLLTESWPSLSAEEQAFLSGPVEEVCRLTDDWQVQERRDLIAEKAAMSNTIDMQALEDAFVGVAKSYSESKKISYASWRDVGVAPSVLKRAGIGRGD